MHLTLFCLIYFFTLLTFLYCLYLTLCCCVSNMLRRTEQSMSSSSPVDQHVHWWPQPITCLYLPSSKHINLLFALPPDLLAATSNLSISPLIHSLTDAQSSSVWPVCFVAKTSNIHRPSHLLISDLLHPSRSLPKRNSAF